MENTEKYIMLEKVSEDLEIFFGESECDIVVSDEEVINIYLDLPNTENYNDFLQEVENFFKNSEYDVEDFEIEGDHEGHIELVYIGE